MVRGSASVESKFLARIELESGISFGLQRANLPLKIGRASDCEICIPSAMVSRHHCELFLLNGVLCLKDTSSNGTLVDHRLVKQRTVSIRSVTEVLFAGEVCIRIIPGKIPAPGIRQERRRLDRRQGDRRQHQIVVNFDRRLTDRRQSDRRH